MWLQRAWRRYQHVTVLCVCRCLHRLPTSRSSRERARLRRLERPKERREEERWGRGGNPMVRPRKRPPWRQNTHSQVSASPFSLIFKVRPVLPYTNVHIPVFFFPHMNVTFHMTATRQRMETSNVKVQLKHSKSIKYTREDT